MISSGNPQLAFDSLGPEIGRVGGKAVRYRGFFLLDRLKLQGFDRANSGSYHAAVVYRQRIQ